MQSILLPLAARTALTNVDVVRTTEKAAHFIINVTVVPGIDTITPKIQGKDALGNFYDILVGAAIVATGIVVLKIGQGITAAANLAAADILTDEYRLVITPSAASSFTYSVTENSSNIQ